MANVRLELGDDALITSKTDVRGVITYCNYDFIKYSEFEENELLGKPHNILRHSDMPKALYYVMWQYIKDGNEIFAFVKNKTKKNNYYWTFANVTISYNAHRKVMGYYSVRRKPNSKGISEMIKIYNKIIEIEYHSGMKESVKAFNNIINSTSKDYNEFVMGLQLA